MAHEENRVDIIEVGSTARRLASSFQRGFRNDVRIGANERIVGARFVAKPLDDRQRVRYRVMLGLAVPRVRPCEDDFARPRAASGAPSALTASWLAGLRHRAGCRIL